MTKRFLGIFLALSLAASLAGCSGVVVEPSQPRAEAVEAAEPTRAMLDGSGAPEPNAGAPEPLPAPEDSNRVAESNEVDVNDVTAEMIPAIESAIEPNSVAAVEPNGAQADLTKVAVVSEADEPNEPNDAPPSEPTAPVVAIAEPNEPKSVAEGQAAALPSFVEQYAAILQDYVREDGRVDYGTLRRRRLQLKRLLMGLGELDPNACAGWPGEERLAFWINAYNLKMLETIARNYPIESSWWVRLTWPPSDIRHIKGIWTDYKFIVMDEEFTLSEVERRFFRKTFADPRAFLAITYATRSSPRLRRELYVGDRLEQQLEKQVAGFLADPRGFRIDRQKKVVYLSALFKPSWRGKEFVARYGTDKKFKEREPETRAVLNFITGYLSREDVYFLEVENYAIEYMNFDWRINDTAKGY